ncbi:telomerase-binding protein EST1A isoform X2 [Trichogramma pretiosum]|uniref:telomerase-binding protein EST1A isoform X2 n=1 Tax=Trichogramma pretiosum TaxID=7493 RepID=UPI0006C98C5C|nr:telomerase-binding protein EST1A isoform X2 [Trichogramma pretiosum]
MKQYRNMANQDKGRKKWGNNQQDPPNHSSDHKFEEDRFGAMRGGSGRPPSRALYKPGSGPLRKSGKADDYESVNDIPNRSRMSSGPDQLKSSHYDIRSRPKTVRKQQIDTISDEFNNLQVNSKRQVDDNNSSGLSYSSKPKHVSFNNDSKRKKKPEQPLYIAKKGKEAMADQDVSVNKHNHSQWDKNNDRVENRDWFTSKNRSQHNESSVHSNSSSNHCSNDDFRGKNKEDHFKRFHLDRKNRHSSDVHEQKSMESSMASRQYGNRFRDEVQNSDSTHMPAKTSHDLNRSRDTHSAEPYSYKPPSGRGSKEITMPKNLNIDILPPRLQAKYIREHGPQSVSHRNNSIANQEEPWDGSTVTFKGSSSHPTSTPHSENWSNSQPIHPARGRGRGRYKLGEISNPLLRPGTPDQSSGPSSRSDTPNQEYTNRSYDRRGSSSTVYTSTENLNRDSSLMPPPSSLPCSYRSIGNRCQSPNSSLRQTTPSSSLPNNTHQTYKMNNNNSDSNWAQTKEIVQESVANPNKNDSSSFGRDDKLEILDWYEEVELTERLEAEKMSRSSSVLSLQENSTSHFSQPSGSRSTSRRKSVKRKNKRSGRDRSRDVIEDMTTERQNNQQNRENDQCNNNKKSSTCTGSTISNNKRFDRRRNNSHRSRESSKERNHRGGNRGPDEFQRNRSSQSQNMEENWRTAKTSICESDDGRRTPLSSSTSISNSGSSSLQYQSSLQGTSSFSRQQQPKRTLFDPNNPTKPIVVTSPGSRAASQLRENDTAIKTPSILTSIPGTQSMTQHGFHSTIADKPPFIQVPPTDQLNNIKPSWYDPCSESFRSSSHPYLLLDIERADLELQFLLSSASLLSQWDRISTIRNFHQKSLQTLLMNDLKFCQTENIEQHFWKITYYNIIEILRKSAPKENTELQEQHKKLVLQIVEEGTVYFTNLLSCLETTYDFKIESYLSLSTSPNGLGAIGLALISAQKIFLFLGDLARYKELINETTNYGKSRQWYLKAQQINPKNGRPYSQLALLATYARRKLDAVYYYMRSLMASNPFPSARESLITMFDENRKKYESTERKRREERELKERSRMLEKESSNHKGLRREIWYHPDGKRVRRTTSTVSEMKNDDESDLDTLEQLSSLELNKRFVTSYLHVHGKLITRVGLETFQEAAIQMLREFRSLLHHVPLPLPISRLLQLLALNMFAIDSTQLKDTEIEKSYRSEVQERALIMSLQMFSLILERGINLVKAQFESKERPRLIVTDDMQILLAAIKVWCDWLLCHSSVWNPPPSCSDYRVGPPGEAWSRLAMLVNLFEKLDYPKNIVIEAPDAENRLDEVKLVKLPEDTTLAGFTPLMSIPQYPFYADKKEDIELVQVCSRIKKILFFGQEFLCGLEIPVLKLQKNERGESEYVSVVETSSISSPGSPHGQNDTDILVESFSEDEDEDDSSLKVSKLPDSSDGLTVAVGGKPTKDHQRQRVQTILQTSTLAVEMEIRPKHLVPDTNCFIDHLPQLQILAKATYGSLPLFTLMVPIVVLNELEGLTKGIDMQNHATLARFAQSPEHIAMVAANSHAALTFIRSKNPAVKCVTTRGTILASSSFTVEEDGCQDTVAKNDDKILNTCLSLCKSNKDQSNDTVGLGQTRKLKRDVVLLTEDRNLRVKAIARDIPVRELLDFIKWARLA